MYIRIMSYKFPSQTKAELFLSLIKSKMVPEYRKRSNCLSVEFLEIGEGKLLSIARFLNKSDYDNTSQWAVPIFKKYVVELEGVIEQLPGELILSYKKE